MTKTLFRHARISTGKQNLTEIVDIFVENGVIRDIRGNLVYDDNVRIIDLKGFLVLPGAIDAHVHFNTPGFEERETFAAGSAFAISGGVTTVIDMPCTSLPPVTDRASLEFKLKTLDGTSYTDYALWGGVSGNVFRQGNWQNAMTELWQAGVVGFKTYALSGMPTFTHLAPTELDELIRFAGQKGFLIGHHAEAAEIVEPLTAHFQQIGRHDLEAYYLARPTEAEVVAIRRIAEMAKKYHARVHIVHISSGRGAQIVSQFRAAGVNISGETCPHYLAFNFHDLVRLGSVLKTAPVVKTVEDNQALWQALQNGQLDFLASDHAPCPIEQKRTGSIWTDYGGISGTGTILLFLYSKGYCRGKITLAQLCELIALNPAQRFGLFPRKGHLQVGADADFVCLAENETTIVHGADFASRGKFTPFENQEWQGKIAAVYLRGELAYHSQTGLNNKSRGIFLKRINN